MSSRADTETARLRRLRRLAQRRNLTILVKTEVNSKARSGFYMLNDEDTRRPVFGDKPQPFSATLDQIEDFLNEDGAESEPDA